MGTTTSLTTLPRAISIRVQQPIQGSENQKYADHPVDNQCIDQNTWEYADQSENKQIIDNSTEDCVYDGQYITNGDTLQIECVNADITIIDYKVDIHSPTNQDSGMLGSPPTSDLCVSTLGILHSSLLLE